MTPLVIWYIIHANYIHVWLLLDMSLALLCWALSVFGQIYSTEITHDFEWKYCLLVLNQANTWGYCIINTCVYTCIPFSIQLWLFVSYGLAEMFSTCHIQWVGKNIENVQLKEIIQNIVLSQLNRWSTWMMQIQEG